MARKGGRFVPNVVGYREVMNGPDAMTACQAEGEYLASFAAGQSGIDYTVDSIQGLNRIHTRVSTATSADYFRERHYRALSIALGANGGNVAHVRYGGHRTLSSRLKKSEKDAGRGKQTGWRAPSYKKSRFR